MAAPTFSEVRGSEGAIDEGCERAWGGVVEEGCDLLAAGREAGEIVTDAFDRGDPVGRWRWRDLVLFETCENDVVDLLGKGL